MTTPRGFTNFRLPMVPGMAAPSPRRTDYKRHSVFDIKQGVPVCNEVDRERDPQQQAYYQTIKATASRPSSAKSHSDPSGSTGTRFQVVPSLAVDNLGADTTTYQAAYSARSVSPSSPSGGFTPRFLRNEQVLRFSGYSIDEKLNAVRRRTIVFYCSDGTMSVSEPEQPNTGLVQGCIFKRQKVPKSSFKLNQAIITGKSTLQDHLSPADLYRGAVINVFGSRITIVDLDKAADDWFRQHGMDSGAKTAEIPDDAFLSARESRSKAPTHEIDPDREKKLVGERRKESYGTAVLRFYANHTDEEGALRSFQIMFYPGEQCVEVTEVIGKNSGRNAVGSARETMRFLSKTKTELDCQDFAVSQSIPLFKRYFFITSCDQFTRSFYANRLGVDLAPNVASPDQNAAQAVSHQPMESLVPKAPRKTTEQIRREIDYAGVKLRYRAAFNQPESDDQALRRFIVTVEPKDDNITIFEEANPAAGTVQPSGGKFLEKTRISLPGGKGFLGAKHFQVGGTFVASAREFKILECDVFTEAFMNSM